MFLYLVSDSNSFKSATYRVILFALFVNLDNLKLSALFEFTKSKRLGFDITCISHSSKNRPNSRLR